jgi:hypothetical protein
VLKLGLGLGSVFKGQYLGVRVGVRVTWQLTASDTVVSVSAVAGLLSSSLIAATIPSAKV